MCGGRKFSEFQVDCLDAHNDYRSRHSVPFLDLNVGLCKYAEDHAKYLCQCDAEKASRGPYGENIFIKTSSRKIFADPYEPVVKWYSEGKGMECEECPSLSKDNKHFAQTVWKGTQTMGVGYAINQKKNKIFIVANYYPPGNDPGCFQENVKPIRKPKQDCPSKVKII